MDKKRFVLVDPDPVYVERFLEYVHRKPNFLFDAAGFTGAGQLMADLEEQSADVVLMDENCWKGMGKRQCRALMEKVPCMILLSDRIRSAETHNSVCRYQSMEKLLPEILTYYEETLPLNTEPEERTQLDIFYSPVGRCGKTTCALLLGHRLAEQCGRTVLYLNLEALAGGEKREDGHSLSDLLYYRQTGGGGMKLQSLAGAEGSLSVLAPVVNPEDIWRLSGEDMNRILREVKEAGIYDTIIIDLGADRDPLPVLGLGRRVFLVDDGGGGGKLEDFISYVKRTCGDLPVNWHRVTPPQVEALRDRLPGSRCEELEIWLEKEWMTWNRSGKDQ